MVLCIRGYNGLLILNTISHTSSSLSLVTLLDAIITVPVALTIIILSLTEHHRSIRPSALLELYFLLSVPPDILPTKYQEIFTTKKANNIASIISTIADLAPLLAEARSKYPVLLPEYQALSPEALSRFLNRSVFWWLQPPVCVRFQ
jgi:ATP-binding cassette subfamily C (CFTR/MRP) protein 1